MKIFRKILKLFVRIDLSIKVQDIHPRYDTEKYQNMIDILYDECLKGLTPKQVNKVIKEAFIFGKTNYSTLTFIVKDNYRQRDGALICRLCGRDDLIDCQYTGYKPKGFIDNIATIEHIIPQSKGGFKYNPINMTITCNKCNQERGVKEIKKIDDLHYTLID